jgi:hypothetical protein
MKTTVDYLKDECIVLLDRVLTGETLVFFGDDGLGQHGRSAFPVTARVRCFDFDILSFSDDTSQIEAHVRIFLEGYNSDSTGHAITDMNLRINLDRLLDRECIDRGALGWAPVELQGKDFITLTVDVQKLLAW